MDISYIADKLYVASDFYPTDEDMPENAVLMDLQEVLKDEPLTAKGRIALDERAVTTQTLRDQGYNVVLRCKAGRNRSAAVAALCLIRYDKFDPDHAIHTVRSARYHLNGGALTNESFVEFLRSSR